MFFILDDNKTDIINDRGYNYPVVQVVRTDFYQRFSSSSTSNINDSSEDDASLRHSISNRMMEQFL